VGERGEGEKGEMQHLLCSLHTKGGEEE